MTESALHRARRLCEEIQKKGRDRGLLIAFEGPDGSGKTTQRKLFKNWLVAEGYVIFKFRECTAKWLDEVFRFAPAATESFRADARSPYKLGAATSGSPVEPVDLEAELFVSSCVVPRRLQRRACTLSSRL